MAAMGGMEGMGEMPGMGGMGGMGAGRSPEDHKREVEALKQVSLHAHPGGRISSKSYDESLKKSTHSGSFGSLWAFVFDHDVAHIVHKQYHHVTDCYRYIPM